MNAFSPIIPTDDSARWEQAITSVNAWRGSAIYHFAQAEAAVSETLRLLAVDPARGGKVRLRHLFGQRLQDLADAIGPEGPFPDDRAAAALVAFRAFEQLRAVLCHGAASVSLDRNGRWVVVLRLLTFKARAAVPSSQAFDQEEAEATLRDLRLSGQRLSSRLNNLQERAGKARAAERTPAFARLGSLEEGKRARE